MTNDAARSLPEDPADWLCSYPAGEGADLYRAAAPEVQRVWQAVARGLAQRSGPGRPVADQVARQIQELGLTFRLTGDDDERDWPLTPMPLIIGAKAWSALEKGVIQRARLLNALAADILGPRRMVAEGHLPAAALAGSPYFARKMLGVVPASGHFLHTYAVDLTLEADGRWRVLSDRLRLANGVGYALENRLAFSRATGSLLADVHTRRLATFFGELRGGLARDCAREYPRIALLTPGRLNQSYPEQAHLARYLGFPLVEGRDLVVTDGRLYVRTIAGPKRIDAVWRWLDTNALDPLAFDARSALGVPDLLRACAEGQLVMGNWPGVEVMESRAMAAYLPRLCEILLREPLALPQVRTIWGGEGEHASALAERLDDWLVAPAFGQRASGLPGPGAFAGSALDADQRAALLAAMALRPMDYCGQDMARLATTPVLVSNAEGAGALLPRPFSLRVFVARGASGEWVVMPGGFARLCSGTQVQAALMGDSDLSADVCIVDPEPLARHARTALASEPAVQRGGGILASQAADNLFWLARYAERAETTLRILRSILGSSIDADGGLGQDPAVTAALVRLLYLWGAISPRQAEAPLETICAAALAEPEMAGSVAFLLRRAQGVGQSLRQRFSRDFWAMVARPMPRIDTSQPQAMLIAATELIERFSAISGQVAENMLRGPAWRFVDIGRRLERALSVCRMVRQLAAIDSGVESGGDALNALLDLCDCPVTYRSRYLIGPARGPVLDLLLLDPDNPRSLAYQAQALADHVAALPTLGESNLPEAPWRAARAILAPLETLRVEELKDHVLQDIETRLLGLSEAISTRYFLPTERPEPRVQDSFLA
ncbi:MAG TPA: circularly permuted type 2 ATP-grasp protein [Novosphingobium sp.]|nr:circularly permuted type 2 ATP-grasp protein [Novosphingobium sp.]